MRRPSGSFPIRAPIGVIAGAFCAAALIPLWFKLGVARAPELQRFYLDTYVRTGLQSALPNLGKQPVEKQYFAVLNGPNLAVQKSVDKHLETLHRELITANPQAFHSWMQKWIYNGSAMQAMFPWEMFGSFLTFVLLVGLGLWWDLKRRSRARDGEHIRGTELLSWREFNREVLSAKGATPGISFTVGALGQKVIIPRELEPYHFNIFGSTGMGKSTLIRELLYQIESRGDVAVVYDTKGEYRDEFFSEARGDIILDPGDQRCPYWAIEAEAQDEAQATPWAMAFWPDEPRQQPFFKKHPRAIFAYLISRYSVFNEPEDPATCAALGFWLTHPRREVARRIAGTEHAVSTDERARDQAQGLWATLGEIAKPLRMMPQVREGRREFTVREWSQKRNGWIFMTSTPDTVDALLPLHSAVMDLLILKNQSPLPTNAHCAPVVWYIIDEAATLQKLPQLESGTTKQRASGNPIVLGFHDMAQLKKRYGDEGAVTIMSQAFTNVVLRTGDPAAAKHAEMLIGHHEVERIQENRPVHLMARHRSRSWSNQTVDSPVVSAAEIQGLPRFTGYLLQEGKVVRIKIQKLARRLRTERLERLIPAVIFREPPERDLPEGDTIAPVDDDQQLMPAGIQAANGFTDRTGVAPAQATNPLKRRGGVI
ncbi:MAG TPA: type IV secretion system DNA-binding domain-containing protein [Bryobacteraceae bacterium]|jgi:type IV secretory pathway TraG/TraD family ATPase VirD4|nr:type IV secretion system DNA-binding domain-containing protein [Bryobacteraceae bacterium]